jgi:hypothetical protein
MLGPAEAAIGRGRDHVDAGDGVIAAGDADTDRQLRLEIVGGELSLRVAIRRHW